MNTAADTTRHFVLVTCATMIKVERDDDGLVVKDGATGKRRYEWNGTHSFWQCGEPANDADSTMSSGSSDYTSDSGNETPAMDYSDFGDLTDLDMPPLTRFDLDDEEDDDDNESDFGDEDDPVMTSLYVRLSLLGVRLSPPPSRVIPLPSRSHSWILAQAITSSEIVKTSLITHLLPSAWVHLLLKERAPLKSLARVLLPRHLG